MQYLSTKLYSVQCTIELYSEQQKMCSAVRCRVCMQHSCIYTLHCTAELQKQSIPLSWIVVPTDPGEDN